MRPSKILNRKIGIQAGVLGDPVKHSLSPFVFNVLRARLKKNLIYKKYKVRSDEFDEFVLKSKNFIGFNITIPHKESAAKLADKTDSVANSISSCNVIKFRGNKIYGYNSDVFGIAKTFQIHKIAIKFKKVIIYGSGGAARSAAYVMAKGGAQQVAFVSRNKAASMSLKKLFRKLFPRTKFTTIENAGADIVINCTPLGMKGVSYQSLFMKKPRHGGVAFDLIYVPMNTGFLKEAQKIGLKTISGLDMFIWQAIKTWEIWFGPISRNRKMADDLKIILKRKLEK